MRRPLFSLLIALASAAALAQELPRAPLQIALLGVVPAGDAPRDGSLWLGLFPTDDGFELRPARVRIVDPEWGGAIDDVVYKELSTEDEVAPMLLLSGAAVLREGAVPSAHAGVAFLAPGSRMSLALDGEDYRLAGSKLRVVTEPPETDVEDGEEATEPQEMCGFTLSRGTDTQLLDVDGCFGEFSASQPLSSLGSTMLLFAGDLDGDGRLDLVVAGDRMTPDGGAAGGLRVYLSTLAGPGQLVGLAGECAMDLSYGC